MLDTPRDAHTDVDAYDHEIGPGDVVAGRYRVRSVLGTGGMGIVYEATRLADGRFVALKMLRPEYAHDLVLRGRLRREAEAARRVMHPNVVELIADGDTGEHGPYVVFELLQGRPLSNRLELGVPLRQAEALAILDQVLAALECAHAHGVVHRDLKPDNVFVLAGAERDGIPFVKVVDFGISRLLSGEDDAASCKLTRTGTVVGTPIYMAPEQALGEGTQDHRVDIYAAGVLLYELLSGEVPHEGENYNQIMAHLLSKPAVPLTQRNPRISQDLAAVVHRAIERQPGDRFATAAEFRAALQPFQCIAVPAHPLPFALRSANTDRLPAVTQTGPADVASPNVRPMRIAVAASGVLTLAILLLAGIHSEPRALAAPIAPVARKPVPVASTVPVAAVPAPVVQSAPAPIASHPSHAESHVHLVLSPHFRTVSPFVRRVHRIDLVVQNPYRTP